MFVLTRAFPRGRGRQLCYWFRSINNKEVVCACLIQTVPEGSPRGTLQAGRQGGVGALLKPARQIP